MGFVLKAQVGISLKIGVVHVNRIKENHILINAEKAFDTFQHPLIIKSLNKLGLD